MFQLIEGRAGDHVLNFRERVVGPRAESVAGNTKPNASAPFLDRPGESTVVDDLFSDDRDSAGLLQSARANQHASSSGTCGVALRIANPGWRVQHEEKEHECRNQ